MFSEITNVYGHIEKHNASHLLGARKKTIHFAKEYT